MRKYPNVVRCLQCKVVLVSNDRHDYKTCSCSNKTMIDGGYDYLRAGGVDLAKVQVLRLTTPKKWNGILNSEPKIKKTRSW